MTAAVDRTKVERQRRYRRRIMETVRAARQSAPAAAHHVADLCGPSASDAVAQTVAAFAEAIRPAVIEAIGNLRRIDVAPASPSMRAAAAIGALVGVDPDPARGATWADLHDRIEDASITDQEIGRLVGPTLAAQLRTTRAFGPSLIAVDSAYMLHPLLSRLGMWRPGTPMQ